jgi:phage anti-repressor protein
VRKLHDAASSRSKGIDCFCIDHAVRLSQREGCLCIDLDDVWRLLYKSKEGATESIKQNLTSHDYFFVPQRAANLCSKYYLTEDAFKAFAMSARSKEGSMVRNYYIAVEKEYVKLTSDLHERKERQIDMETPLHVLKQLSGGLTSLIAARENRLAFISDTRLAEVMEGEAGARRAAADAAATLALQATARARVVVEEAAAALAAEGLRERSAVAEASRRAQMLKSARGVLAGRQALVQGLNKNIYSDISKLNAQLGDFLQGVDYGKDGLPYLVEEPEQTMEGCSEIVPHIGKILPWRLISQWGEGGLERAVGGPCRYASRPCTVGVVILPSGPKDLPSLA